WRAHVDAAVLRAFADLPDAARALVELGIHHEQQHQELLLTDIKHLFAQNPLGPAVWEEASFEGAAPVPEAGGSLPETAGAMRWIEGADGIVSVGHAGEGFAFDCEAPQFSVLLTPHALASRPVTNSEWQVCGVGGGYRPPSLGPGAGGAGGDAGGGGARPYGRVGCPPPLGAWPPLPPPAPATHVSFYGAGAFAGGAGAGL